MNIQDEIKIGKDLLSSLHSVLDYALIGSAMYLEDAKDVDFAVLIDGDAIDYTTKLHDTGWGLCGDYDTGVGIWAAVRKGNLNFMVTHSPKFFQDYKTAMEVCKALKLTDKEDRIMVCRIVRDGFSATAALDLRAFPVQVQRTK